VTFAIYETLDLQFVNTVEEIFVQKNVWGYFPAPNGPLQAYWRFYLLLYAMEKHNVALLDFVLKLYPSAITDGRQADHGGVMFSPPVAFVAASTNNKEMVQYFLSKGFPVDYYCDDYNNYAKNLLSVSSNAEMDAYLRSMGVPDEIEFKRQLTTKTVDHDIRVRDRYGLQGKVLAKMPEGLEVELLAITAKSFKADGVEDRWIKIRLPDGTVGWSFYKYFYKDNGI
jgi:hypothetical protein